MEPSITSDSTTTAPDRPDLVQLLECSVCLSLLCEPISISCGHTFCRLCLVKSLKRHKKQCPSCREVCHISAGNASENIVIKSLAVALDPSAYAQKLAESAAEKATWNAVYPIFLYNQTLFPGSTLSLHLFEPRYKLMMTRIVGTTRAFAYVCAHRLAVGSLALVAELRNAEFLADGRCLVEATLCKRSRIVEFYLEDGTQGLYHCSLEQLPDEPVPPENTEALAVLRTRAMQLAERLLSDNYTRRAVEEQFGRMPAETATAEVFSMWFSSVSPLSDPDKLLALHTRDTAERLRMCSTRLESYLDMPRGRGFPVVNAIGSTLASTLSALWGTGTGTGTALPTPASPASRTSGAQARSAHTRTAPSATTAVGGSGATAAGEAGDDGVLDLVSDSDTTSDSDGDHVEDASSGSGSGSGSEINGDEFAIGDGAGAGIGTVAGAADQQYL